MKEEENKQHKHTPWGIREEAAIYIVAHDPMLYVHSFFLFSEYEIPEIWWTSWLIEQYAFLRYLWKGFFSCIIKKITNI